MRTGFSRLLPGPAVGHAGDSGARPLRLSDPRAQPRRLLSLLAEHRLTVLASRALGGRALGGRALGGRALGGRALGGRALGGTVLVSGVRHGPVPRRRSLLG